ncbi:MAG: hypothetical protein H0U74_04885 [Bradymonadaceae bacterium]|nr:hypothetical protein [Lujinxingiaceae bacterium]
MFNRQNASKILWLSLGCLLFASVLVPNSWTSFGKSAVPHIDAFSEDVRRADTALSSAPDRDSLAYEELARVAIYVQTRRLLRAGPMTSDELRRAAPILQDWQEQIAGQAHEGSRRALRAERNRELAAAFSRLDVHKIELELDRLDAQLMAARDHRAP